MQLTVPIEDIDFHTRPASQLIVPMPHQYCRSHTKHGALASIVNRAAQDSEFTGRDGRELSVDSTPPTSRVNMKRIDCGMFNGLKSLQEAHYDALR